MKEIIEVLNRLQREGILPAYAIGGGMAALAYIEPFLTEDVDVFATMVTASGLVDPSPIFLRLKELGYSEMVGDRIVIGEWPVQFLPPAGDLESEAVAEAREEILEGISVRIFTAEHLMAIALKTARAKDHARIEQFMESGRFDLGKLNAILNRFGLNKKWDDIQRRFHDARTD